MSEPLLDAQSLEKSFGSGRTRLNVLRNCSLAVQPGEFVAIMGKSGSGKSTLLHILGALDAPDVGEVRVHGSPTFRARTYISGFAAWLNRALLIGRRVLVILIIAALILAGVSLIVIVARSVVWQFGRTRVFQDVSTELDVSWVSALVLLVVLGVIVVIRRVRSRPSEARSGDSKRADRALRTTQSVIITLLKILIPLAIARWALVLSIFLGPPAVWALAGSLLGSAALVILLSAMAVVRLVCVDLAERRRVRLRRSVFGFVFQFYHLLPELNALENVLAPRMTEFGLIRWWSRRRAAWRDTLRILERVGLSQRLKHRPSELSGGECQRVAIARALVHKPRILFADEPTGNLDAEAGANIMSILSRLHREGQTIVMVTHDPSIAGYADRTLVLEGGRLRPA